MKLQPHQQRVCEEKAALDSKIDNLHNFIAGNPLFEKLPNDEQERLKRQDFVMAEYSQILSERIAAFPDS